MVAPWSLRKSLANLVSSFGSLVAYMIYLSSMAAPGSSGVISKFYTMYRSRQEDEFARMAAA
jgi:hypothetical protein